MKTFYYLQKKYGYCFARAGLSSQGVLKFSTLPPPNSMKFGVAAEPFNSPFSDQIFTIRPGGFGLQPKMCKVFDARFI